MISGKISTSPQSDGNMEEKILATAEKLFFRKGYAGTSTTEIAREVGCNQGLVHYYFRTKEKLFHAVLTGKVKNVFKKFLSLETGTGTFEEKLRRMIEIHFDTLRDNSDIVLFLVTELSRSENLFEDIIPEIGDMPVRTLEIFKSELQAEIDAGAIRSITLRELILNVISLNAFPFLIKPAFAKVWGYDDEKMEEIFDNRKKEVADTIIRSLRP